MSGIGTSRLRTADLDEAIDAVTRIYCPHALHVRGSNHGVNSELAVNRTGALPIVYLKYSAPVDIDAGDFNRLMLMMSCTSGSGWVRQGRSEASWQSGQTVPMCPDVPSQLAFDVAFAQRSVRIDLAMLDELCGQRVGRRIDNPVRFSLLPFSAELENAWQGAIDLALAYESRGIELPRHASKSFNEFMLSLLLDLAPHNYSDEMRTPHPLAAPRALREAEQLMRAADGIASVHEIAAALAVSVRSLEAGFREWKQETPVAFMRRLRLARAREQLADPGARTTVTDVALSCGFLHLSRFAHYYRAAFNEHPSDTLRSARRRLAGCAPLAA
jgi:AraC-like DNA-binding protein